MVIMPNPGPYLVTPDWFVQSLTVTGDTLDTKEMFGEDFLASIVDLLSKNRLTAPTCHWNYEMGEDTIPLAVFNLSHGSTILDQYADPCGMEAILYKTKVPTSDGDRETVVLKVNFGRGSIDGFWL